MDLVPQVYYVIILERTTATPQLWLITPVTELNEITTEQPITWLKVTWNTVMWPPDWFPGPFADLIYVKGTTTSANRRGRLASPPLMSHFQNVVSVLTVLCLLVIIVCSFHVHLILKPSWLKHAHFLLTCLCLWRRKTNLKSNSSTVNAFFSIVIIPSAVHSETDF